MTEDWLTHDDTKRLKKELRERMEKTLMKLVAAGASSEDPNCRELAHEYRTIESFIKELSGEKNGKRQD